MFCHVEPEQVRRRQRLLSCRLRRSGAPTLSASLNSLTRLVPGHLCARRVVHLQSTATAGETGRGELPEQETEHAHRDSTQENAD